ncbi:hypothetical protein ATY39_07060 [Rummeliibacillus stabekisii]|uniref:Uncharacterized protein n=1 Tax=Rummeliibacillus stabekisii TaxID=241244 RepID=A0A143HCP8_9BACL|nr:hypothetical protein ATY39_07060 [Rummeliibacillus stabekisii]
MRYYFQSYKQVLKKDIMLVLIALVLLFFTFGYWLVIPVFYVSLTISNITNSIIINYLCILFSVGFLFSLYFLPINLKVARNIAVSKKHSFLSCFLMIEVVWIVVAAILFGIAIIIFLHLNYI